MSVLATLSLKEKIFIIKRDTIRMLGFNWVKTKMEIGSIFLRFLQTLSFLRTSCLISVCLTRRKLTGNIF